MIFRTRYELFKYLVTLFSSTRAPATFKQYINWVIRDYLNEFCTAYVNNILIFTSGLLRDHRVKIRMVLGKLQEAKVVLNIDKCQFEKKRVKYLGFIIKTGVGLKIDPEKLKAIWKWEAPKIKKGVRAFSRFANYYKAFINKFAIIVTPFTVLTGNHLFLWILEIQKAFENLKKTLFPP